MAGTSLDGKGVADTVAILHPFTTFDDNSSTTTTRQARAYYANVWNAVIKNFEEHSILPAGKVTSDDVVWGGPIWRQIGRGYRTKSDDLLKKTVRERPLAPEKQQLVEKARSFYANFDFLDAYRSRSLQSS